MSVKHIIAKHWRPTARRLPGGHRKSRHLPEYADRFEGRVGRLALCDWTEAPTKVGITTGRWWYGCPEQMFVTVGPLDRRKTTTAIAFLMMNREPNGATWSGKRRPHKYKQAVRSFYYDLGIPSHVDAFLRVSRMLIAFVAGKHREDFFVEYPLKYVQPIGIHDGDVGAGYEQVWIEDGNLTIRRFVDVLHRKTEWRRVKGGYANLASEFTIPLGVAERYAEWAARVIPYLFSDQLAPHNLKPRSLDPEWLPRARHALEWEAEPAVFDSPEMYKDAAGILEEDPSAIPYTYEYLTRLDAYTKDRLRWNPAWVEQKLDVQADVRYLRWLFTKVWPSIVFLQVLCKMGLVLRRKRSEKTAKKQTPSNWRASSWVRHSQTQSDTSELRIRAPP